MRNKFLSFAIFATASVVLIVSCKKADSLDPMRQFTPTGAISVTSTDTTAVLSWAAALYTQGTKPKYDVQLSKDSTFTTIEQFLQADTNTITISDNLIPVRVKYFARVRTKGADSTLNSKWLRSNGFQINGEQIFFNIRETELRETSVTFRWRLASDVTKITLKNGSNPAVDYAITPTELAAGVKTITGLTPNTTYTADIYTPVKSKGVLTFTTQPLTVYSFTVSPTDNLVTVLDTCSNNAVIGLQPGTYTSGNTVNFVIKEKTVTLKSLSGDPSNTKVNFKEITLKGAGAGVRLSGIEFDGSAGAASYFINLVGTASDAAAAVFTNITVENCNIKNYGNCIIRANRGTNAGDHKITNIKFRNCLITNNTLAAFYSEFTLDKLQFVLLDVTNTTFNGAGQTIVSAATTMTTTPIPVINLDGVTVNNFGANAKYALFDASANPVNVTIRNSIFANAPRSGSVLANPFRATSANSTIVFSYNNTFKLTTNGTTAQTFPTYSYLTMQQNRTIDLGWTATTTDLTLPAGSELRTGGSNGGPIGDPRWAF